MNAVAQTMYDFGVRRPRILVTIERPDGTVYEQEIEDTYNNVSKSVNKFQNDVLGNPYKWYTDYQGKKQRYLKKDAYIVVDWRVLD